MDKVVLNEKFLRASNSNGSSSKGNQRKWFKGNEWYKADFMGYEGLSEVLISQLLKKSNIQDFVAYTPVVICCDEKETLGCVSKNFRNKEESLLTFESLYRICNGQSLAQTLSKYSTAEEKIRFTVEFVESVTGLHNIGSYLTKLLELDAFFLNEDRHTHNLAVIRNNETGEFRLCPVFDNGLALLSDTSTDYPSEEDPYNLIQKVKAKPFADDFFEQMEAAESLYESQIKFAFTKKDVTTILETLRPYYGEECCNRVRTIVFEQMRKYQVFFDSVHLF